jgi:hypothetical protein
MVRMCHYCGDEEVVARIESHLKGCEIPHNKVDEYKYYCHNCYNAYIDGQADCERVVEMLVDLLCEDSCQMYDECPCPSCEDFQESCNKCFKEEPYCGKVGIYGHTTVGDE